MQVGLELAISSLMEEKALFEFATDQTQTASLNNRIEFESS